MANCNGELSGVVSDDEVYRVDTVLWPIASWVGRIEVGKLAMCCCHAAPVMNFWAVFQ